MVMGFSQERTCGLMLGSWIGARNTVPSRMERIVPLGLFHIWWSLYSSIRWWFGVIVAHFTATPYFLLALAASIVTWSLVWSR